MRSPPPAQAGGGTQPGVAHRPDWVLIDVEMAGMDGLRATKPSPRGAPGRALAIVTQNADNATGDAALAGSEPDEVPRGRRDLRFAHQEVLLERRRIRHRGVERPEDADRSVERLEGLFLDDGRNALTDAAGP